VLPVGVQVTSLEPQMAKDGAVSIRLRVSGDRGRAVQLVRNLETSQRFVSPRLAGEAAQTQDTTRTNVSAVAVPGAVEFEILSGYNPLPALPMKKDATKDASGPAVKVRKSAAPAAKKHTAPAAKTRGGR